MSTIDNAIKFYHAAVGGDSQTKRVAFSLVTSSILASVFMAASRLSELSSNSAPIFDLNRSFIGVVFPAIPQPLIQLADFLLFFLISIALTQMIIHLNTEKDKTDVYTPLREALRGNWQLNMVNFSSIAEYSQFTCNVNLHISKSTEKLRASFSSSNQLGVVCNVLNVGLSVSDDSTLELLFIADQSIVFEDEEKNFKYLIQLKGAETAGGGHPQFQGTWYELESIGSDFRSRGVASMIRQGDQSQPAAGAR